MRPASRHEEATLNRSSLIIGAALVLCLGLVGAWAWVSRPTEDLDPGEYVDAPGAMADMVELGSVGILTSENFVGHRIRVVEGTLTNIGEERLLSVELRVTFQGVDGTPVQEFVEEALRIPLTPGASRRYSFRYENLPAEWDYRVPQIGLSRVGF